MIIWHSAETILLISIILVTKIHGQISTGTHQIFLKYYVAVYNKTMDFPLPKFIQYKDNVVGLIMDNRIKYVLSNLDKKPEKGETVKKLPQNTLQYTDSKGFNLELIRGDVRSSNKKMVVTKQGYKIIAMLPDKDHQLIYFIAKPNEAPPGEGSVFVLDTSAESRDLITTELAFMGNRVTTIGADPTSGNVAFCLKVGNSWNLVILKEAVKPVITTTEIPIVIPKEIPSTTTPRIIQPTEDFESVLLKSINDIREIYERQMGNCMSLTIRGEYFLKKYAKVLKLSDSDSNLVRMSYLPNTLLMTNNNETISSVLEKVHQSILTKYVTDKSSQNVV